MFSFLKLKFKFMFSSIMFITSTWIFYSFILWTERKTCFNRFFFFEYYIVITITLFTNYRKKCFFENICFKAFEFSRLIALSTKDFLFHSDIILFGLIKSKSSWGAILYSRHPNTRSHAEPNPSEYYLTSVDDVVFLDKVLVLS